MKKQQFNTKSVPTLPKLYLECNDMLISHLGDNKNIVTNIMLYPDSLVKKSSGRGGVEIIDAIKLATSDGFSITISIDAVEGDSQAFMKECRLNGLAISENTAKGVAAYCKALLQEPDTYFPNPFGTTA